MNADLDRLIERFERLERDVEELKRTWPGERTVDASAEPGTFAPPVPDAPPPLPAGVGSTEAVVLVEPIPDALERIVLECLAKRPEDRPADAPSLEQTDTPATGRKMQRTGQGVVAGPDKDRVVGFGHFFAPIYTGIIANAFNSV